MNENTRKAILALADAIEVDEIVINYKAAKDNFDNDETLSTKINEYTVQRMIFEKAASEEEKDEELLKQIDNRMKELYEEVMANPVMVALANAENELNGLLNDLNTEIQTRIIPESEHSCSGDCAGCSGCH
ncbi:MAG: YlbF family regulator [Clostridia bacterium]|nr:YlbF family regulator [Clostridia bacterium]MBR6776425.1 YlbF family regulator [Clostridia bacterium]